MGKAIGCDLGTSNSCVAVIENGKPQIIPNSEGKNTTPSVVGFMKDGERKVGDGAKRQAVTNPKNTVYEIKRFMGCETRQIQKDIDSVTYQVDDLAGYPRVNIDGKLYTPQEISSMILQKMKQTAEDYLGEEVKDIVITVPAYFNDAQRQATKEAGEIAGLNVLRIINEPTAAALAYGLNNIGKEQKILVFDFGGGTHDVSLLDLSDGIFEVVSTSGDCHLGGKDIDNLVVEWIVKEIKSEQGVDVSSDMMAMQRIKEAAEKAKIELSSSSSTDINLPYITADATGPKHFVKTLSRATFEQMISDIVRRTMAPVEEVLKSAKLDKSEIDEIILVGGSTRIPLVQKTVEDFFGKQANKSVNPDEVVAAGASIQASLLSGDNSVADGKDILLLDVTPLSLGIETLGGVMTTMIEANTTIPFKHEEVFSTAEDNQTGVGIHVLQAPAGVQMARNAKSIGRFMLDGIAPARRGVPQIEVTFDIDANGILNVSAKDKATNKEQKITITASSGLSKEEIERMKAEAEANAEADKKERENVDKANNAEQFAYSIKNTLEESAKDVVTEEESKAIKEKADALSNAAKDKKYDELEKLQKELEEIWSPIAMKMYQKQQEQANTSSAEQQTSNENAQQAESSDKDDNIEDVPFEEVTD